MKQKGKWLAASFNIIIYICIFYICFITLGWLKDKGEKNFIYERLTRISRQGSCNAYGSQDKNHK